MSDEDLGALPPNPEFVPGSPEYVEKRARLRAEVRDRLDRGEGRVEVEDWLIGEGLDPGDATRMVDVIVCPASARGPLGAELGPALDPVAARRANAEARRIREQAKPVTDPTFAFADGAESADHVREREVRARRLYRAVAVVTMLAITGLILLMFATRP